MASSGGLPPTFVGCGCQGQAVPYVAPGFTNAPVTSGSGCLDAAVGPSEDAGEDTGTDSATDTGIDGTSPSEAGPDGGTDGSSDAGDASDSASD